MKCVEEPSPDTYKEEFAKFCEGPDRSKFRELLKQNTGEYAYIDFKEKWLEVPKFAKHILGFANSGGGVLVIGVREENTGSLNISSIYLLGLLKKKYIVIKRANMMVGA